MDSSTSQVLRPDEGQFVHLLALGVRFMIDGERTAGAFSLVEHPLPPRALGSPLHTHRNEDEYSYILEGQIGLQVSVTKPCWPNLEISFSSRAGFHMHSGMQATSRPGCWRSYHRQGLRTTSASWRRCLRPEKWDEAAIGQVVAKYELEIDFATIPILAERHGLRLGRAA